MIGMLIGLVTVVAFGYVVSRHAWRFRAFAAVFAAGSAVDAPVSIRKPDARKRRDDDGDGGGDDPSTFDDSTYGGWSDGPDDGGGDSGGDGGGGDGGSD